MLRGIQIAALILLALLSLTACQTQPPQKQEEPPPSNPLAKVPTSALISKAIDHLGMGETSNARLALEQVLEREPHNRRAADLLEQMTADPIKALGEKHFMYEVKSGDSMSSLANRFLKDPLKFYILSRYNGIADPSRIKLGQTLKIPGDKPPGHRTERLVKLEKTTTKLLAQKHYLQVVRLLELETKAVQKSKILRNNLIKAYDKLAQRHESENRYKQARNILNKRLKMTPGDKSTRSKILELERKLQAIELYNKAQREKAAGNTEEAFSMLSRSLKLFPEYKPTQNSHASLKRVLINQYHRTALKHYRKQELSLAIENWNRVLQIDPNHQSALGYRAKAIEMKARLSELGAQ